MSYRELELSGVAKPLEDSLVPSKATRVLGFPEACGADTRIRGWIFFDADCALCAGSAKRAVGFLGGHGFVLVPLQTPGTAEYLGVTAADLMARMHLLTSDGRRFAGADAFVEIVRHLNWMRPLAWVAGSRCILPGLRRIYDWIAANRYCFGGTCRVPRRRPMLDWLPLVSLPAFVLLLRDQMAGWVFMWAMAFALFAGCKWLTYRKAIANSAAFSTRRKLGYLFGWVGMNADAFAVAKPARTLPASEWRRTVRRILVGAALVWGAARLIIPLSPLLSGWVAMFGIILLLHFGTFQLLALIWQRLGVGVEPLMRTPLLATSLGDFWGARWNTGFHALAHEFLFRPLSRLFGRVHSPRSVGREFVEPTFERSEANEVSVNPRSGPQGTRFARTASGGKVGPTESRSTDLFVERALPVLGVFFVSGLIHEVVITLPARSGYGLPTAYFLLQGVGLVLERSAIGRRLGLGAGLRGRLFAIVVVTAPAFWLFPPVFVRNVILPMLEAIGAL